MCDPIAYRKDILDYVNSNMAIVSTTSPSLLSEKGEYHGFDTEDRVHFYEHDFYCLSNFSSFTLFWKGILFYTLEHAYHWEKFVPDYENDSLEEITQKVAVQDAIRLAPSAHVAYQIAQHYKESRRSDWDGEEGKSPYDSPKALIMLSLMTAKTEQHEYVATKLEKTGDREIVEDSWRDAWWGWGPNKDGLNMAGKLWMLVRTLRRKLG